MTKPRQFDLVVAGGQVCDGTGAALFRADVGVNGERVTAVEDLTGADAKQRIDATGRIVAPGFIDVHTHTDVLAFLPGHHEIHTASVRQGVTTEICGNCGFSPFPADPAAGLDGDPYLSALGGGVARPFARLRDYRDAMRDAHLPVNRAPLVGHATLRTSVLGYEDRAPSTEELEAMRRLLEQAMEDGAFGMSTGLVYPPGQFADADELVALASVLHRWGRRYTSHLRDEIDHVVEAVDEALDIGRRADVGVQISHHKVAGPRYRGRPEATLERIVAARDAGQDVTADVYPYSAASTLLAALLPPWANAGTPLERDRRLRDTATRDRIRRDHEQGLAGWQNFAAACGWHGVVLTDHPDHAGRSITEIAEGRDPWDVVCELLLDEPTLTCVLHLMAMDDVMTMTGQSWAMVGSDGLPAPGRQHPRVAGTFARTVASARNDGELIARVHQITGLPAATFGLQGRGELRPGAVADLVVFDGGGVRDRATYEEPWTPPEGIDVVIVAGTVVIDAGRDTGARPGAVLEAQ